MDHINIQHNFINESCMYSSILREVLTSKGNQSYLPPKEDLCQCLSPSRISCAKCLDPVMSNKHGPVLFVTKQAQKGFKVVHINGVYPTQQGETHIPTIRVEI
jgi:hypothetical protein